MISTRDLFLSECMSRDDIDSENRLRGIELEMNNTHQENIGNELDEIMAW